MDGFDCRPDEFVESGCNLDMPKFGWASTECHSKLKEVEGARGETRFSCPSKFGLGFSFGVNCVFSFLRSARSFETRRFRNASGTTSRAFCSTRSLQLVGG